jgi:transcriptional regulator with XRE-family HTH domain
MTNIHRNYQMWGIVMGSPKVGPALERLGQDIRNARLRRSIAVADLALRAGTSASSIARLERATLALLWDACGCAGRSGLVERLADLIDVRKDDLACAF